MFAAKLRHHFNTEIVGPLDCLWRFWTNYEISHRRFASKHVYKLSMPYRHILLGLFQEVKKHRKFRIGRFLIGNAQKRVERGHNGILSTGFSMKILRLTLKFRHTGINYPVKLLNIWAHFFIVN